MVKRYDVSQNFQLRTARRLARASAIGMGRIRQCAGQVRFPRRHPYLRSARYCIWPKGLGESYRRPSRNTWSIPARQAARLITDLF